MARRCHNALRKNGRLMVIGMVATASLMLSGVFGFPCQNPPEDILTAPFDLHGRYHPSGFMGDHEQIEILPGYRDNPSPGDVDSACIRFRYRPSSEGESQGWAGVYWQRPPKNWGEHPGAKVQGASKLTFWVRGENGGELVTFRAGGILNLPGHSEQAEERKFSDSFEVILGQISLTSEWEQHEIPLENADLSCVIGAISWTASAAANPGGLTFYIDRVRFE